MDTTGNLLITGGHSGMGLELTKKLLNEGHRVGIIVRSESRREDALEALNHHSSLEVFIADLSKRDQIEAVTNEIRSKWDHLDGIFNNAGLLLDQLYYSDYGNEMQLEVNAISPYLLTKALYPLLEKADQPFVVNTATAALDKKKEYDIASFKKPEKFVKLMGSYMDSKLTLVLLMNNLGKQWKNVRFVNVNPGAIKTKMTKGAGMPKLLLPIRHLLFKSPQHGAENLYEAAYSEKFEGSNIYVNGGKIRPIHVEIEEEDITLLLS